MSIKVLYYFADFCSVTIDVTPKNKKDIEKAIEKR